ncbi:uncharacterized protein K02A2.6-like [Anneissia japonica]|uniref:uncharacterized protein K02A2.6-like n=1 Tax=Anneissia japonica TaxID=1529436 RepID=UPI001425AB34|nr:uncharacterized protein K02A2.6-like [Anneissia japonica]
MRYNPVAKHVPGKAMVIAETLSRSPMSVSESTTNEAVALYVESITTTWPASASNLEQIRRATKHECQTLLKYILDGWPRQVQDISQNLRSLYDLRGHFSADDGLITFDDRIYIPSEPRGEIMQRIHDGHQGVTKCRKRAKESVWWLGISKDISNIVKKCGHCQLYRRTQKKEPLITTPIPERPWQRISMEICDFQNNHYLIVSDYFSRYIEMINLRKDMTSQKVITAVKGIYARWRIPETVVSDNGPQFAFRQFRLFAAEYGFQHVTTSPLYPQGNGEAERAVQTAKTMLRQNNPVLALMIYRSTPIEATGYSPAQMITKNNIADTCKEIATKMAGYA